MRSLCDFPVVQYSYVRGPRHPGLRCDCCAGNFGGGRFWSLAYFAVSLRQWPVVRRNLGERLMSARVVGSLT